MNIEAIKAKASARELEIINDPKCRITKYDPRESGSIGQKMEQTGSGYTFFSVCCEHSHSGQRGYAGERHRIYRLCAWHEPTCAFVI